MNNEQLKEPPKPAAVAFNKDVKEKPKPTFWFKKDNGSTFCAGEKEAWMIVRHGIKAIINGSMQKKNYEYLGCSDGKTYFAALAEVQVAFKEQGIEAAQKLLREAEAKELETADLTIKPQNQDIRGNPQAVREFQGSGGLTI